MKHLILFFSILSTSFFSIAQDENSLLWSISKEGSTDTSFLYGSIHIKDKRVFDVNSHFNRVFEKSKSVALELHFDSINPFKLINFIMMEDGQTLKNVMDSSKYLIVKSFFEDSLKRPIQFVERFQPLYISTILSEMTAGEHVENNLHFLDEKIFNDAKTEGKNIIGLEKVEEQMQAFNALPYEMQSEMLYESIINIRQSINNEQNEIETLTQLYINQDLNGLSEYVNNFNQSGSDLIKPYEQLLKDKLLTERNLRMSDRALPLIEEGTTLIVVGAAHLPDENGLINLLRQKGYTVSPL